MGFTGGGSPLSQHPACEVASLVTPSCVSRGCPGGGAAPGAGGAGPYLHLCPPQEVHLGLSCGVLWGRPPLGRRPSDPTLHRPSIPRPPPHPYYCGPGSKPLSHPTVQPLLETSFVHFSTCLRPEGREVMGWLCGPQGQPDVAPLPPPEQIRDPCPVLFQKPILQVETQFL